MRIARRRWWAVLVVAGVALAGCGSDAPSTGASPVVSASTPSASPSPLPTDGTALSKQAFALLRTVSSFHAELISDARGFDVRFGEDDVAVASVTSGSAGTVDVRRLADGRVYVRGDAPYYASVGAGGNVVTVIADRWVLVGAETPDYVKQSAAIADRETVLSILDLSNRADLERTVQGPTEVDGISAYVITVPNGATLAVAAQGDPYPIRATDSGNDGALVLDGYGDPVTVEAPPATEVVEVPA